jgi:hypothetical protein
MATNTLSLQNVFGVNVEEMFREWFQTKYIPSFRRRYGTDQDISAILLDPRHNWLQRMQAWEDPQLLSHIVLYTNGSDAGLIEATAPGGTLENVRRKLRPCLRHLCSSRDVERLLEYLCEGDFPWEGADEDGGVSGLKKEEDAKELKKLEKKLRKLFRKVLKAAIKKAESLEGTPEYNLGGKYLIGINVADQFPGYEAAEKPFYLLGDTGSV